MEITVKDLWEDLRQTRHRFAERGARAGWEVVLEEPGLWALAWYRLAQRLHQAGFPVFARALSLFARRRTGIDLHPAARIGRRCLLLDGPITIGAGVVLGDDCTLEPGAILTGGSVVGVHPTLGSRVVVESGAVITGEIFLGNDVRVMAGAVVSRDVADGGMAVGVPGRVLARQMAKPDPDARAIQALAERVYHLEEQLQILAFATQRLAPLAERWKTRDPKEYGPIAAVEALIDGAGI